MTHPATEYERADHERDLCKHEPRPTDRLTPAIPTAVEIAALVKGMDDIRGAARLIEQYARTVAAGARLEEAQRIADRIAPQRVPV